MRRCFTLPYLIISALLFITLPASAQNGTVSGIITSVNEPVSHATVVLLNSSLATIADSTGHFLLQEVPVGSYTISVSLLGHQTRSKKITVKGKEDFKINFDLIATHNDLEDVVVTG
ncbi:MAG: carboxypeptidase-like regulatory domain-containing protein, partial [Segetibacter sp.]